MRLRGEWPGQCVARDHAHRARSSSATGWRVVALTPVATTVSRGPMHPTRVASGIRRAAVIGAARAAHAVPQLSPKRIRATRVELDGRERPTERGEWTRERATAGAEFDDRPVGRADELDDAIDHAAIDEEVLAELVPSANGFERTRRIGGRPRPAPRRPLGPIRPDAVVCLRAAGVMVETVGPAGRAPVGWVT